MTKPKSSFQIALAGLDKNSVGADEVQAMKVCEAADDLLEACKIGLARIESDIESSKHTCWEGDVLRAAITKATGA